MRLDPKQTEALLTVIETGSFEQAGARLHVTPSAISQRVRALEEEMGAALVIRSRPVRATRTGQRLLQHLRRVMLLEEDLASDLAEQRHAPLSVTIAVNADTLGTWFFPALAELLAHEQVLLDLIVEDQDHTYDVLETGMATGCVSTEPRPMKGCFADPLGIMRYRMVASTTFAERWFPEGLTRAAARTAPVVAYTRKDALQANFLQDRLGLTPGAYPCHYVPGCDPHYTAIRYGMGYGLVPELLVRKELAEGTLVDLAPAHPVDLALFWHAWKVQSPRMEIMSRRIGESARQLLAVR
ncbi:HTH-type transcriptional regulator ArgP [Silvimonas amylolytica]|uniref:Chromosome replication initiation inhibitor n=1 Tax=Silvimonas amylolytica TaxID=449663 RepID=A0ABQ2PR03_9NEIS|nr:HTH-type transcriptional regulator ArgP [Silvimonas amylolytica]GGP27660.1 chromosome replication initiation inhibitor [Silvimonas amylolytica]